MIGHLQFFDEINTQTVLNFILCGLVGRSMYWYGRTHNGYWPEEIHCILQVYENQVKTGKKQSQVQIRLWPPKIITINYHTSSDIEKNMAISKQIDVAKANVPFSLELDLFEKYKMTFDKSEMSQFVII